MDSKPSVCLKSKQSRIMLTSTFTVMDNFLQTLPCTERASVLELDHCLEGTRTEALSEIFGWTDSDANDERQLFLLTGPSGSGKSAIASSVARHCLDNGSLGASFAFRRGRPDHTADRLFPTIARDLAEFNPDVGQALYDRVRNTTVLRETGNLELQYETFILASLAAVNTAKPVVIVIDALDEAGDKKTRSLLLRLLSKKSFPHLRLRIFVTSRPEHDILKVARDQKVHRKSMDDVPSTNEDISRYVRWRLTSSKEPDLEGIEEESSVRIAHISQGLFQFAFLACELIMSDEPGSTARERYEQLIRSSSDMNQTGLLDHIYTDILSRLFPPDNTTLVNRFKAVMAFVLASFEPLSMHDINILRRTEDDHLYGAEVILRYLGSLLSGVSTANDPIILLHTSFRDFLTEASRGGGFLIDLPGAHKQLALASLRIMHTHLKFNICEFETSYQRNCEILDLAKRIQDHIPAHLSYACRYGIKHACASLLVLVAINDGIWSGSMKTLLTRDLLHWLEALSLLDAVPGVRAALLNLKQLTTVRIFPVQMFSCDKVLTMMLN